MTLTQRSASLHLLTSLYHLWLFFLRATLRRSRILNCDYNEMIYKTQRHS